MEKILVAHTINEMNLMMEIETLRKERDEILDQWYRDNDRHIRENNELRRLLSIAEKKIEVLHEAYTDDIKSVSKEAAGTVIETLFGYNPYQE